MNTRCRNKETHILCPIHFGYKLDYALRYNEHRSEKQHICFAKSKFSDLLLPCNGAVCRCKIRHIFIIPGEQINPLVQDETPTSANNKWHIQHCERLRALYLFYQHLVNRLQHCTYCHQHLVNHLHHRPNIISTLLTTYSTVPIVTRTL